MTQKIQKLTWPQVRKNFKAFHPKLAKLIDDLNPDDEHIIYKVTYPWGQHLLAGGTLCLPNADGRYVPLSDPSIDPKLAEDLAYNISMPLGMVVKNSIELYINALGRTIPFVFMPEGTIFGLWVSLQDKSSSNHTGRVSNIIAGSRTALFLPKISDAMSFKKLKKVFGLQCRMPDTLVDQWPLLNELAHHPAFPQSWENEVIYFSKKWLEERDDVAWKLFKTYLLELAWTNSGYLRNQMIFDLAFSCALEEKNLRPNPYLTDTVKHLFAIGQNIYPGYEIATNSQGLPLDGFQEIFANIYGLKYQPTMLVPGYLQSDPNKSIYYSLEIPTLMSFSPKSRKNANKLDDLREIKHVTERVTDYLKEDELRLEHSPLNRLIHEVNFEYYHSDEDIYHETLKTHELPKIDKNIMLEEQKSTKEFCDTSPFLRGCIRIAHKNSENKE